MRHYELSPSFVLWLIRDQRIKDYWSFIEYLREHGYSQIEISIYSKQFNLIVQHFEEAGLIEKQGKEILPTALIEKVLGALKISLTELSQTGPDSLIITPIFGKPAYTPKQSDIFVLMPFSVVIKPVFDDHIKKVALQLSFTINRADDFFTTNSIISDIWKAIYSSKIIIADCTSRNPNVFYEIGIAHTIGKPVILISQSIEDIPFDLRHIRCIIYQYTPRGMSDFEQSLYETLKTEKLAIPSSDA